MGLLLKQSTARNRMLNLGATSLTPTITLSKNGGAFGALAGTVTEVANNWYKVALTSGDTDTLGDLAYASDAGTIDADACDQVVVDLPGGTVSSVTGNVDGSVLGGVFLSSEGGPQFNGTLTAATSTTFTTLSDMSLGSDTALVGAIVRISPTGGVREMRTLVSYNHTTKVGTVDRAWAVTPTNGDELMVFTGNKPALGSALGVNLASTGLDSISTTAPSGVASTFREMMVQVWRRYFKRCKNDKGALTIKTYADDGTTVVSTQNYTTDSSADDVGAAS